MNSLLGWLFLIAMIAGVAIGLGLLFGAFNTITSNLNNSTITIPQEFTNSINTAQSFAGTGIIIALAVAIVGLVMIMIRVVAGGFSGE